MYETDFDSLNQKINNDFSALGLERDAYKSRLATAETDLAAAVASGTAKDATIADLNNTILALKKRIAELETPPPVVTESRRSGPGYVAIEDLGVTLDGDGLVKAVKIASTLNKQITLPGKDFLIKDYTMGTAGTNFLSGIMLNPNIGTKAIGFSGTIDTRTGLPVTGIGMVPNSSHFTGGVNGTAYSPTLDKTQSQQATLWGEGALDYRFQDFNLLGSQQPHYHHGIRTAKAKSTLIENVHAYGASQGDSNSPPGETYTWGVTNATLINCTATGMLNGVLHSATIGGFFGSMSNQTNVCVEDMIAGFHTVWWETTGTHNVIGGYTKRPGTGTSGKNGSGFNIERSANGAVYNIQNHEWLLDGAWPNPLIGVPGKRAYPNLPVPRHEGKFGHVIILGESGKDSRPILNVIEPTYDPWGHPGKGGFHVYREYVPNATVKVVDGGVTLSKVYLPQWWVAPASFDPAKQYYESDNVGQSGIWG